MSALDCVSMSGAGRADSRDQGDQRDARGDAM